MGRVGQRFKEHFKLYIKGYIKSRFLSVVLFRKKEDKDGAVMVVVKVGTPNM